MMCVHMIMSCHLRRDGMCCLSAHITSGGGEIVGYRRTTTLNPYQIYNLNTWPSVTFTGSVVVTATRPVGVQVNHVLSGATSDGIMSHSGVHR